MIWCPQPSPETSYCSVPYSSAHPSLHFHYRSSSERRGSKSSWFCTLFHSCPLFWEKKISWTLSVIFYIPPMCYNLGFTCGEGRTGKCPTSSVVSEGKELNLQGLQTPSHRGEAALWCHHCPSSGSSGKGHPAPASPYSLPILHQHHSSLLQLIPITAGLSRPFSFPSCHSMGCPMQHREGDLQKVLNPHCLGHPMGVMVTPVTPLASSPLCSHEFQDIQNVSQGSNILNPDVHALRELLAVLVHKPW